MCFLAFRVLQISLNTRSLFKLLHHDSLLTKNSQSHPKLNQSYFRVFCLFNLKKKKERKKKKQDAVVDGTNVMKKIHHYGNERN